MKTIALRFAENFAPKIGTVAAHQQILNSVGYVWYGKLGNPISSKVAEEILLNDKPKILLIHSGKLERYWAYISEVSRIVPPLNEIPDYYRNLSEKFNCWFKITTFEEAPRDIMSKCYVASSNVPLTQVSKHSMSPYFIINVNEVGNESI